jgi:gliding motility-associated-like protein
MEGEQLSTPSFTCCIEKEGDHIVNAQVTDNNTGCVNSQKFIIKGLPVPKADFYWLPEKPVENIDNVQFVNNSQGKQSKWTWFFMRNDERSENENSSYFFEDEGKYPVAMIVENEYGCSDSVLKIVTIEADFACYIPNAFTPNTDGKNELFMPVLRGVSRYLFSVYNRWGMKLFQTENQSQGWDGTYNGEDCMQDVYIYKVLVTPDNGRPRVYEGQVMLYR